MRRPQRSLLLVALTCVAALGCATEVGSTSAALGVTPPGGDTCVPHTTPLLAGQHHEAGTVTLSSDGDALTVAIETTDGWMVEAYHIYVGTGPVPTNGAGAAPPGRFPYKLELPEPTESASLSLRLDSLGVACGDTVNVAVHAEVARYVDGSRVQAETAWADGPNEFRRGWGTWLSWDICCPGDRCVMPKFIWRDHPDWWDVSSVEMGGSTYDEDAMMTLLWTPAWGDASIELAHQVIGAELNIANGATPSPGVAAALDDAYVWLDAHVDGDGTLPYGVYSIHDGFAEGRGLANYLRDWNEGLEELPLCQWW